MANENPPTKGTAWSTDVVLEDALNPGFAKVNPTLASGDVKVSKDNGAKANLATLPSVSPASSEIVTTALDSTEMNADKVTVIFHDQTVPAEWSDYAFTILTTA